MMLQIHHRVSFDIDIFLPDPQLLGFLDPDRNDLRFETPPDAFLGDGTRFSRFVFKGLGEIDFIASPPLTANPSFEETVAGRKVELETIPEIVAKKIHFRGKSIQTRDLFDLAAASVTHPDDVRDVLRVFPDDVRAALAAISRLNPAYVNSAIQELQIMPEFLGSAAEALSVSRNFLRSVLSEG